MPARFGAVRLVGALLVVFAVAPLVGRGLGNAVIASRSPRAPASTDVKMPQTWLELATSFAKSLVYMTAVTVPLIFVGVVLSSLLLPHAANLSSLGAGVAIPLAALVATLIALPTFFEIPIALLMLQLGAPPGVAVALLVAGPIVNVPSLFVLGRESNVKVALAVGGGVWLVATLVGFAANVV